MMKSILFISVGFRQYDTYIQKELQKRFEVYYINTKLLESKYAILFSLMKRLHLLMLFKRITSAYIQKCLAAVNGIVLDYVFVIKGEYLTRRNLELLRGSHPNSKYILYLWDAWLSHDNKELLADNFSDIYTFDAMDSIKYKFKLRPLFYILQDNNQQSPDPLKYCISFVGGNHSNRLDSLKKIKEQCLDCGISFRFVLNMGKMDIIKHKYIYRDYNDIADIVSPIQISYNEYLSITNSSVAVVDFPNPLQTGLTIRTIEALSLGKKIITTNKYIGHYKNLPLSNIMILDSEEIDISSCSDFLSKQHTEVLSDYYSLENFLEELVQ